MNLRNRYATFLFLLSALTGLYACKVNRQETGYRKLEKNTDTLALQQNRETILNISNDLFDTGTFTSGGAMMVKYRLLKPPAYTDTNQVFPLVIVFHGSGAVGDDNNKQLGLLAKLWAMPAAQARYPAFVLVPQFAERSSDYIMDSSRGVLTSVPRNCLGVSLQLIDSLKGVLNIDEEKIYATGFSMGASSVINALSLRPELFAAAVSISGIPQFDRVQTVADIPLWLIHGTEDTENPPASDRLFYKEAGFKGRMLFWELEQTAHNDILPAVVAGEKIPQWLFAHKKLHKN